MISKRAVLLVAPLLVCLVCLPLMQSTHVPKSVKSREGRMLSFTNNIILSLEIWANLLCHKNAEFSFDLTRFTPITEFKEINSESENDLSSSIRYIPFSKIPEPTILLSLNKLKQPFLKVTEKPILSSLDNEIKLRDIDGTKIVSSRSNLKPLLNSKLKHPMALMDASDLFPMSRFLSFLLIVRVELKPFLLEPFLAFWALIHEISFLMTEVAEILPLHLLNA
ncbi:hypothetical protein RND81_08G032900 [Saponaria officinalis]|uniref:Uncharacterized protein n=1 Tax=Saponaria officinalis TaxID=3572 RepID=A0AAW1J3E2_SAPOF